MKRFFSVKALVLSFVLAMICVLPVSAQKSDDFFRVDDDTYSNRDVVGMIWTTGGFTPADPEAPIGSGLLIMVAAGAGYVVVRRRRSIRKGTTLLLAFAILLGLTQCKKKVDTINAVVTNGIPMTLEAYNGGRTSITDGGVINWTAGDKIYVVCNGSCIGYVQNTAEHLTTFTGSVDGITTGDYTFHYYYVGNQVISNAATSFEMDFSDQTGNLDDLGDFHVGHGSQEISYTAGDEISAAAEMTSLVSVGYFDIAGMAEVGEKVFMYGENVNNKISINFSTNVVTNTKVDTEHNNNYISLGIVSAGATCGRYVMLVPNDGTETTISFVSKRTSGSYTFPRGIETGKFYCKNDNTSTPLTISPVEYTPGSLRGEFTINDLGEKVHFSSGNLVKTDGTYTVGDGHETYAFETTPFNTYGGSLGYNQGTPTSTSARGYFTWDEIATADETPRKFTVYDVQNWRAMTYDECDYILWERDMNSGVKRFYRIDMGSTQTQIGFLITPDRATSDDVVGLNGGTSPSSGFTQNVDVDIYLSRGFVFLPAVGAYVAGSENRWMRNITHDDEDRYGYYWLTTEEDDDWAYFLHFFAGGQSDDDYDEKYYYCSVRLVRDVE